MKKAIISLVAIASLTLGSITAQADTSKNTENKLSRYVYVINQDKNNPNSVERFEDPSFPLRPEFFVFLDGKAVEYGKYKPVFNWSGMFAVPLLQTLKAAEITYTVEGKNYVFTYQQATYKIAYDGTAKMSVIFNGKSNDNMKSGAYETQVVDGELYVNARVIQTIFYHADPLTASLDKKMREEITYVPYDTEALHERERFLNLYTYDPYANKQQSNAALKKVMENIPPEYYVESLLPEDEKAIIKQKAQEITSGITSDFDKLKAIHQWVAKTIAYDMDLFNNDFTYVRGKTLKGKSESIEDGMLIGRMIHLDAIDSYDTPFDQVKLNHLDLAVNIYMESSIQERLDSTLAKGKRITDATLRTHLIRADNIMLSDLLEIAQIFFHSKTMVNEWIDTQFQFSKKDNE